MNTSSNSIIAVTGASGFLGWELCKRLAATGHRVRMLMRYRGTAPDEFQFDLGTGILDPAAMQPPVRAVVHCAWDIKTQKLNDARRINVQGTQQLIDISRRAKVEQFVFVSSMAAHSGAFSVYGKTKWEVEQHLLSLPDANTFSTIIQPGTVIGKGGVFAQARNMVKRLPVVPIFYGFGGRRLQTVFIDDLCNAILASIEKKVTGRLCVAENDGVSLADFYRGLATLEHRHPLLLPFPGGPTLLAVRLLEAAGLKLPVSSSNLQGIKGLRHCDVKASLSALGCDPMSDFQQSLRRLAQAEEKPEPVVTH